MPIDLNIQEGNGSNDDRENLYQYQGMLRNTKNANIPLRLYDLIRLKGPLFSIINEQLKEIGIDLTTALGKDNLRVHLAKSHPEAEDHEIEKIVSTLQKYAVNLTTEQIDPDLGDMTFSLFLRMLYLMDLDIEMNIRKIKK